MSKIIQVDDYSFVCPDDEISLLEAMETQQIEVEYQCRQGFCGTCRVKLVQGNVTYFEEPIAVIPDGCILPCCCRSKNDVVVEFDNKQSDSSGNLKDEDVFSSE